MFSFDDMAPNLSVLTISHWNHALHKDKFTLGSKTKRDFELSDPIG